MKSVAILNMIKKRRFVVDLRTGNITISLKPPHIEKGPYAICRTEIAAELYSLNILSQNAAEENIKNGQIPLFMRRRVFGEVDEIKTFEIHQLMEDIKINHPEELI